MPLSIRRTLLPALFLSLAAGGCGDAGTVAAPGNDQAAATTPVPAKLATVPLVISRSNGAPLELTVEVARTAQEQERGLMARAPLPVRTGMLFPFAVPRTASFWMKDTPSPLDIIFIRPDGTIAAILPGRPYDLQPVSAGEPVSAVLEIAGGSATALGIAAGDRVAWGDCASSAQAGDADSVTLMRSCPE